MSFQPTPESCLTLAWLDELMVRGCHCAIAAEEPVGAVFDKLQGCADGFFRNRSEGGSYVGLISKGQIGMLLSGRYSATLFTPSTKRQSHLLTDTVVVRPMSGCLKSSTALLAGRGKPSTTISPWSMRWAHFWVCSPCPRCCGCKMN